MSRIYKLWVVQLAVVITSSCPTEEDSPNTTDPRKYCRLRLDNGKQWLFREPKPTFVLTPGRTSQARGAGSARNLSTDRTKVWDEGGEPGAIAGHREGSQTVPAAAKVTWL